MNTSAPHRGNPHARVPGQPARDRAAPYPGRHGPALRRLALLAAAAFTAALATGCASHAPAAHLAATPRPPATAPQPASAAHRPATEPAAAPTSPASPASP